MRKGILLFCLSTFVTTASYAQQQSFEQFPILQCPATNEVMVDFRNKLLDFKRHIKSEANCEPIRVKVEDLTDLVTQGRDNFLRLTTKGQIQGLSSRDLLDVESYATKLTTTTSDLIAVITGNDACFAEDKQGLSLSFITSLIGEGAKVLSLVGGPTGGTISLAANVITGFLKGMDEVRKNKIGYKFENFDQRVAYANTLCSFFEYRRELDSLLNPYDSISTLENLQVVIESQITALSSSCPECAVVIDKVNLKILAGANTPDTLWTEAFEKEIILDAEAIDKLYTRKLGTHTYRSLQTRSWLPQRIQALQNTQLKADLGLQGVTTQMFDIERFLLNSQVPGFLDRLVYEGELWRNELVKQILKGHELLFDMEQPLLNVPNADWQPTAPLLLYYDIEANSRINGRYAGSKEFYDYVKNVMESLELAQSKADKNGKAAIRTYFRQLDDVNRNLKISVDLMDNYCTFFGLADWYLRPEVSERCESQRMKVMRQDVAQVMAASPTATANLVTPLPAQLPSTDVPAVADLPENERDNVTVTQELAQPVQATTQDAYVENITPNWAESLTLSIQGMENDPHYFDRSN